MKLIIAGSRGLLVFSEMIEDLRQFHGIKITEVVSGGAAGIDKSGEYFAGRFNIPVKQFIPDWNDLTHPDAVIRINNYNKEYDATAGHRRNTEMANYADALLVIWDGKSSGSKNMLDTMKKLGKPVYEVVLRKHNV